MHSPGRWSLYRPLATRLASTNVSTSRRGRNLTDRYRTTRARGEHATHVSTVPAHTPDTIVGIMIPKQPRTPADDECCMSGCAVCVYDLYEEELAAYKDDVKTLCAALTAQHIPESEWPAHIRTGATHTPTTVEKLRGAVLDAFQEMERALEEKRAKRAAVESESSS